MLPKPPSNTTEPSRIPAIASSMLCTILWITAGRPASGRLEHRHRRAAFGLLEDDGDRLADAQLVEIAIDDVGQHRRSFGKSHVSDGIGLLDALHHAEGVDRPLPGSLAPLDLIACAERTDDARIPVRLAAGRAEGDQEPALARRVPERLGLGVHCGRSYLPGH